MTHPTDDDPLYTFAEAMSYLRVGRSTIYRLLQSGELVGSKVGSTWRFRRSALEACIQIQTFRRIEPAYATSNQALAGS